MLLVCGGSIAGHDKVFTNVEVEEDWIMVGWEMWRSWCVMCVEEGGKKMNSKGERGNHMVWVKREYPKKKEKEKGPLVLVLHFY